MVIMYYEDMDLFPLERDENDDEDWREVYDDLKWDPTWCW